MSSVDDTIASTIFQLKQVSQDTADRFAALAVELPKRLSTDDFEEYAGICVSIAESGWRSFVPVNLLIDIARFEDVDLLRVARFGNSLSNYSFEPASRYLETVRSLARSGRLDRLPAMEAAGNRLAKSNPGATTLIAQFFEVSRLILQDDTDQGTPWFKLVEATSGETRADVAKLLQLSLAAVDSAHPVNWPQVLRFQQLSTSSALTYLEKAPVLSRKLEPKLFDRLEELLLLHVSRLESLIDIALSLELPATELAVVLELGDKIGESDVLVAFLECASELPLAREAVLRAWLQHGLRANAGNARAMKAYVQLDSLDSVRTLDALKGQVNFHDHRRTFDLLAESLSARPIEVVGFEDEESSLRSLSGLPETNGRQVRLPASVNLFEDRDDNFGFYKVSLFHQIGYVEFGCFPEIGGIRRTLQEFEDSRLAERLFVIVEDARIDWQLSVRYPGLAPQLARQKSRAAEQRHPPGSELAQYLEFMVLAGLDALPEEKMLPAVANRLCSLVSSMKTPDALVSDSLEVASQCYELLAAWSGEQSGHRHYQAGNQLAMPDELPPPIDYRGELDVEQVESVLRLEAVLEELQDEVTDDAVQDGPQISMPISEQDRIDVGELKKGDVDAGVAVLMSELDAQLLDEDPGMLEELLDLGNKQQLLEFLSGIGARSRDAEKHRYDEWDYEIGDYRPAWCTLYEYADLDEDLGYADRTMQEHQDLARRIRQQLNKVKPEMLRKVKGVIEGEDLDLERSIAYMVDRKAGLTPEERIYVQRQRKDRDVSTLFLLDMSASTDDIIHDPDAPAIEPPDVDDDEYLVQYFQQRREYEKSARRIIDLEKQSALLMADALESLGDAYSVCGFSGYGRDQVDYFLCKDFDESLNARTRGRIGGIKPCRSTRMGPPIRHATQRLVETGSRIKALIIISDGYPQDHDYGTDRNSRDYGLMDTMKALGEAKQQGVLTYCLTVDPSGHDYLRAMCPDSQYMVIQDIDQLPEELSRVYRSLTG